MSNAVLSKVLQALNIKIGLRVGSSLLTAAGSGKRTHLRIDGFGLMYSLTTGLHSWRPTFSFHSKKGVQLITI